MNKNKDPQWMTGNDEGEKQGGGGGGGKKGKGGGDGGGGDNKPKAPAVPVSTLSYLVSNLPVLDFGKLSPIYTSSMFL